MENLTADQLEWRRKAHEFAKNVMRPLAERFDRGEGDAEELARLAQEAGIRNWWIPKEYGGPGATGRLTGCLIGEEIAWGCLGMLEIVSGPPLPGHFLLQLGTEEQRKKYLPRLADPSTFYRAAMAMTEEGSGSDVAGITTEAVPCPGGFRLRGNKKFITNGDVADVIVMAARVRLGSSNPFKLFLVEPALSGRWKRKRLELFGVRGAHVSEMEFEDVFVPEDAVLGAPARPLEADDLLPFLRTMEWARIGVGTAAVGIARAALEFAQEHAEEREIFGQALIRNQAIAFSLVDAHSDLLAARLLVWHAARMADAGEPFLAAEGNIAKYWAAETAARVVRRCEEVLGGRAFLIGNPMEKWSRDVKACAVWEGTPNIIRMAAARMLFREF